MDQKLEYVATFWPDTDVSLICNDWEHSLCSQRLDSDTLAHYSCKTGKEILYPLSRGKPAKIPSMKSLCNEVCFRSEYTSQRLMMPWTGLTMLEKDKELILVAVNAVGDLFEAVIGNEVLNEDMEQTTFGASFGDTSFDMFDYENPFHNCSYSEKEKTFIQNTSIPSDEFLFTENNLLVHIQGQLKSLKTPFFKAKIWL